VPAKAGAPCTKQNQSKFYNRRIKLDNNKDTYFLTDELDLDLAVSLSLGTREGCKGGDFTYHVSN